MRQKGSFRNWYKMIRIIKALKCCRNQVVVCQCPGAFFRWWPWVDLDHFYDRVEFVPDASVWVTAYRALSALVFLIQHILSTKVSDTGPMILWFCMYVCVFGKGNAPVNCNHAPPPLHPRGRAGYSRENVPGFYFCIVPTVPGKCRGFVFFRWK